MESIKKKTDLINLNNQNYAANSNLISVFADDKKSDTLKSPFTNIYELINYLDINKQPQLAYILRHDVEITDFSIGNIKFHVNDRIKNDTLALLNKFLQQTTGRQWTFDILPGKIGKTIADIENEQKENDKKNIADAPLVKAILEEFHGAKIETLTRKSSNKEIVDNDNEDSFNNNQEDYFNNED